MIFGQDVLGKEYFKKIKKSVEKLRKVRVFLRKVWKNWVLFGKNLHYFCQKKVQNLEVRIQESEYRN